MLDFRAFGISDIWIADAQPIVAVMAVSWWTLLPLYF
jgi:hypothetical protein